jgi:NADP-dependent 3-hydroxy acid dehydrogenase YdfG
MKQADSMVEKLDGKVALITGASSGIGMATAKTLAGAGARVVLAARRVDRLNALVAELGAKKALAVEADVGNTDAAADVVKRALDWSSGQLDILFNNAGVSPLAMIADSDLADIDQMIRVNLTAVIAVTRAALPALTRRGGDIVNMGSVAVRVQNPGSATYAATKMGVAAFTESLRKEVRPHHVRVTLINPGIVKSGMSDSMIDGTLKERTLERYGTELEHLLPEDIADLVLYCVSRPPRVVLNDVLVRPSMQE